MDLVLQLSWYEHDNTDMNQEGADCTSLLRSTSDALDEEELQKLVISAQQANIVLNIEYAVKR